MRPTTVCASSVSSTPTSTPTSSPGTWKWPGPPVLGSATDRVPRPNFRSGHWRDGERITLGEVTLEIMHTPGHTPESISVLVYEHADDDVAYGVLTGDALFIGDVGRPDLLASIGITADELGHQLYDSIQRKLMGYPTPSVSFPPMAPVRRAARTCPPKSNPPSASNAVFNYACQPMSEPSFVALVTAGQPPAPDYFVYDAILNRKDRAVYDADQPLIAFDTDRMLGRSPTAPSWSTPGTPRTSRPGT